MEKQFDFERLDVYQRALDFISKIYDLFEILPYRIQKTIGNNLLRAAVSIANNLAEGSGRRMRKEKRHFFEISQGSIFECIPMITILRRKKVIPENKYEELYKDCYDLSRMTTGLVRHFS